jgi:CubicO group peptidase (beta-lactamase class C family)
VAAKTVDPQGVHVGGGGQKFTARDLLKLGRLWLDEGRWQGRQIVPVKWMKQATGSRVETGQYLAPGYGYQFWVTQAHGHAAFAALGYGGQVVEVVPELDPPTSTRLHAATRSPSPALGTRPTRHVG